MNTKKKKYGLIAIAAQSTTTLIEILVLLRVLPINVIGGGKLETYSQVVGLALVSISIQLLVMLSVSVVVEWIHLPRFQKVARVILKIMTVYLGINIVMNCLGETLLEQLYQSLVCIICMVYLVKILKEDKKQCV